MFNRSEHARKLKKSLWVMLDLQEKDSPDDAWTRMKNTANESDLGKHAVIVCQFALQGSGLATFKLMQEIESGVVGKETQVSLAYLCEHAQKE